MIFRVLLLAGCMIAAPAEAQSDGTGEAAAGAPQSESLASVHVIVENVESSAGTIWLALCNVDLTVEGCPYKASVPAKSGFAETTFEDIPPGGYAVVGYHDLNDNNEFDKFLGVPREPYALSGAAGDMLVPTFEDAVIQIKPGANDVIIHLKWLGG